MSPILTPSKKTSTVLFASEVPLIKRVLSEVIPSLLLLPVSSLIEVITGDEGTEISIVAVSSLVFPILPTESVI